MAESEADHEGPGRRRYGREQAGAVGVLKVQAGRLERHA